MIDAVAVLRGQWLNYSKISSDTEIPKETVRRYLSLLEDTLLLFKIPPFQPRRKLGRRVSHHEKIILFDVGVRNAILGLHRRPVSADQLGHLFEQWMILQVLYLNRAFKFDWRISSYRTEAGAEVDLVIEREDDIVGLEIKSSKSVNRTDFIGLKSLAETIGTYKPAKNGLLTEARPGSFLRTAQRLFLSKKC